MKKKGTTIMNENNNMTGTTTTAMALASSSFTGRILKPADFTVLDGLIQSLGDKSATLTPDEKAGAIAIIDEWNTSVTARISANAEQARRVLAFLDGSQVYGRELEDIIELFHDALGDTAEYNAYRDAVENYAAVMSDRPLETPIDSGMTIAQSDKVRMDNYAASLDYGRLVKQAEHRFNKAVKAYIMALRDMPEVKDLRGSLNSYKNKASRMAADCQDKATRAKLNVTISDPYVRKALHEMMDFAKTV